MKIKKTVGFTARIEKRKKKLARACDLRKSYTIHTDCGEQFTAEANGSQGYIMRGTKYKSLKEAKQAILTQGLEIYFPSSGAVEFASDAPEEAEVPMNEQGDLWDCIHPCALLIKELPAIELLGGTEAHQTLSNYGWLNEDGSPDEEKAEREYERIFDNLSE